jgi:carboxylesterase
MSARFFINLGKPLKPYSELPDNGVFLKGDNGCVVILIHGLTGTPNEMKFLAGVLHKKGYSVSCPRLANHGQPMRVLKDTKWQDFYQTARTALLSLAQLTEQPGASQLTLKADPAVPLERQGLIKEVEGNNHTIFVAGLSMGALLALLLAAEFPTKISGVSCLSPTLFYDGWNMPWYRCFLPFLYLTPLKHFFYFKEDPPYGIKNEQIREWVHRYYSQAAINDIEGVAQHGYPFFPITLLYELHLLVKDLSKRLAEVRIPVQLIQAKEDDVTSVKNSQFIYERVGSSKKEMVLLDNSYHMITADQERDKVAEKMEKFFRGIYQPGGSNA